MWKRNQRNHCSDDVLLAHADGELSANEESWTAAHLLECWECRGRLEELDGTARTLARLAAEDRFGGPDRAAAAKASFLAWRREFERELDSRQHILARLRLLRARVRTAAPQFAQFGRRLIGNGAAAAALPLIALAGLGGWYYARHSTVEPPAMLTPARKTAPVLPSMPATLLVAPRPSGTVLPEPSPAPIHSVLDFPDLRANETEVLYALHRVRACLEEPIEVVPKPEGGLLVRGIAGTAERKSQLLAVLGELENSWWLATDIKTAGEGAGTPPAAEDPVAQPEAAAAPTGEGTLYFRDGLERHFAGRGRAEAARLAIDFANRAVSASDSLLSEAWALRRLAERYGPQGLQRLRPQSLWLVEVMARDHLEAFTEQVRNARAAFEPVFITVVGPAAAMQRAGAAGERSWHDEILEIFEAAQQIRRHTIGLFAGAGLPAALEVNGSLVRVKSPEETLQDLRTALAALEIGVQVAEDRTATEFSVNPGLAATGNKKE